MAWPRDIALFYFILFFVLIFSLTARKLESICSGMQTNFSSVFFFSTMFCNVYVKYVIHGKLKEHKIKPKQRFNPVMPQYQHAFHVLILLTINNIGLLIPFVW